MEWLLTVVAIVLGPFLGIWVHGKLEDRKTTYQRKLDIFKTLMATRATPLARAHVESLNRIDIEFTEPDEKKVRDAWAVLLDHYGQGPIPPNKPPLNQNGVEQDKYNSDYHSYEIAKAQWDENVIELRATLLEEMGKIFGYDFDKVKIKKAVYNPRAHGDIEFEQILLLKTANDVLTGIRPIGMHIVNWPTQTEPDEHNQDT